MVARQTGSRQSTPLSTILTRYGNSVSAPEAPRTCKTQQNSLQKGSRYGISVSTGHDCGRRFCGRLFLRSGIFRIFRPEFCPEFCSEFSPNFATTPTCYRSLSGPSGGCLSGCLWGPSRPGLRCPKSVPRVSPECQKGVPDTPGTLSGHFLDTPEPGAGRAPETPRKTLPGHFGPEGPERLL